MLKTDFFNRSAENIAKELLGTYLVRKREKKVTAYKIIETEAYVGPHDKASHAHRGRTKRNEPMFDKSGHWYVYLCYGMHWMLNLVTGPKGYPAAVLIRGVETDDGKRIHGPGRVTKLLNIDTKMNGKRIGKGSGLWIESRGESVSPRLIEKTPRVGVAYALEWADKPLRFVLKSR